MMKYKLIHQSLRTDSYSNREITVDNNWSWMSLSQRGIFENHLIFLVHQKYFHFFQQTFNPKLISYNLLKTIIIIIIIIIIIVIIL